MQLTEEEKPNFSLHTNFKPDLAISNEARDDALLFFKTIREFLLNQHLLRGFTCEEGRQVILGVPGNCLDKHKEFTEDIARQSGFTDVKLQEEPKGAMFFHLCNKDITAKDVQRGVLVIDFGGGTFDVAYLKEGKIIKVWGNPVLGGRIWDDLFYKWFLDQNGGLSLQEKIDRDGNLSYVRGVICRQMKEDYSNAMARTAVQKFRYRISVGVDYNYGVFQNASEDEFFERMKCYQPSEPFLYELKVLNAKDYEILKSGSLDLLKLIKACVRKGSLENNIRSDDVSLIILTGGSGRWPFVKNLISDNDSFPLANFYQSPDPEATIARGLGMAFAREKYEQKIRQKLNDEENKGGLKKKLVKIIEDAISPLTEQIASSANIDLYDAHIVPEILNFRKAGGRIKDLEYRLESHINSYQKVLQEKLSSYTKEFELRVQKGFKNTISEWLTENIGHSDNICPSMDKLDNLDLKNQSDIADGISNRLANIIGGVTTTIIGLIVASIAGGAGFHLIMHGPVG